MVLEEGFEVARVLGGGIFCPFYFDWIKSPFLLDDKIDL